MKEIAVERTYTERTIQGYEAKDGTKFYSCDCMNLEVAKEECERYEKTAYMVVRDRIQKFKIGETTEYGLSDFGCDDNVVEIYRPKTDEDVTNLLHYFELCNASTDGKNKDEIKVDNEIIVWWNYDHDYYQIDTYETYIKKFHDRFYWVLDNYKEKKDGQK